MKKLLLLACTFMLSFGATVSAQQTSDSPLSELLNSLRNKGTASSSDSTANDSSSNSGSSLGNVLGGLIGGLLSNDELSANDFVGSWSYVSPAVCFQSENFLQKAGGSAAAATIEGKIEPYYNRFGLNKLTLTVDEELNFTMQSGRLKATGTISIDGTDVYFNFSAFGKLSLGKIKTYVTKSGSNLSVMFDVTKLISIIKTIGSATNISSINTITNLLDSYDGICAGFKLQRQ